MGDLFSGADISDMTVGSETAASSSSLSNIGWLRLTGTFMQMLGMNEQARSIKSAGKQAQLAAALEAQQADQQAKISTALSQRAELEQQRQGDLVASRALAVAAASGGGASDPTIVHILSNIRGESAYKASVALYEGEDKARKLRLQATSSLYGGDEANAEAMRKAQGIKLSETGVAFKGVADSYSRNKLREVPGLYEKYGGGGPEGSLTSDYGG